MGRDKVGDGGGRRVRMKVVQLNVGWDGVSKT